MKHLFSYIFVSLLALAPVMSSAHQHDEYASPETENDDRNGRNHGMRRFDPEKYQRDLEAFIVKFACLTEQEAQQFFPIFREMQQKTRAIYMKGKKPNKAAFTDNKLALEAIHNHDAQEIEIKKLQQQYHNRFLKVLPATKVLKCIFAEDSFNKNMMRNIGK